MKNVLRKHYGRKHIDALKTGRSPYTMDDLSFAKKIFKNPQAITGHNLHCATESLSLENARYITILREPISRCASHYQDLVLRNNLTLSFADWIHIQEMQNLSVRTIAGEPDLGKAKLLLKENFLFVGITEQFETSLKLFQHLTEEVFAISNKFMIVASSNKIKNKLLADESSMKLLKEHNKLDIELYNFALEEIFLPAVDKYADQINDISLSPDSDNGQLEQNRRNSIRYNKFVYRQAIKLFN